MTREVVTSSSLDTVVKLFAEELLEKGEYVDTGHWQAIKDVPQTKTVELRNESLVMPIESTVRELQSYCNPNLPWAEDHFLERVGGEPLNPGEQYKNWPWYRGNVPTHQTYGDKLAHPSERQFSHTYMERYWPKFAGPDIPHSEGYAMRGIRYDYGDLNDLVDLLVREPNTRQAYLPMWFPEDTGAAHDQRVPCSLGYHFLLRSGKLHINYYIRSCDLLRHFKDDVYLTARLCQWVLERCQDQTLVNSSPAGYLWGQAVPGELTMIMSSLHVFEGDLPKLRREYGG